jgi:dipeptidyl aminopeptidase/acylaminoacyl peptidase
MNHEYPTDHTIESWVADLPGRAPDRILQTVLGELPTLSQQGRLRARLRRILMTTSLPMKLAGAAVITVAATAIGVNLLRSPGVGGVLPSPAPTAAAPEASSHPSSAPWAPPAGEIAVVRTVDGNTDIYLLKTDGSVVRRLTDDRADDRAPHWSPDGSLLVFARGNEDEGQVDLYVLDVAGRTVKQLTTASGIETDGRFSPDGTRIVYEVQSVPNNGFWTMNADGSNQRRVFDTTGSDSFTNATWAADGAAIYFNRDTTGPQRTQIVRLTIASGEIVALGDDGGSSNSQFVVSADGATFAFVASRNPSGIYLMNADGSDVRFAVLGPGGPLAWSPDGAILITQPKKSPTLYFVQLDDGAAVVFSEGSSPAWRPEP